MTCDGGKEEGRREGGEGERKKREKRKWKERSWRAERERRGSVCQPGELAVQTDPSVHTQPSSGCIFVSPF